MKKAILAVMGFSLMCGLIFGVFNVSYAKGSQILQYEFWLPPKVPEYTTMQAFYKGLEKATGGAVKVQFNPGGAMGKGGGAYQSLTRVSIPASSPCGIYSTTPSVRPTVRNLPVS
ncbi:MAG: hypothetical protein JRJ85_04520 [Deltaproteobacteria bacterium]|nr:hypothetical protein [Deltaproteobacteria bacterium]